MKGKNQRGITLIALVVTIVVLLILAGITINLVFNEGGILNRANQAKKATEIGEIRDNISLDIANAKIETNGRELTDSELLEILRKYGRVEFEQGGTVAVLVTPKGNRISVSDLNIKLMEQDYDNELNPKKIIPENCFYIKLDGTKIESGERFPLETINGDIVETNHYKYVYDNTINGWKLEVKDKSKQEYESIFKSINNLPIKSLVDTFNGCSELLVAPLIPEGIVNMEGTFNECKKLVNSPILPSSVINLQGTFRNCSSLKIPPIVPENVINMSSTFARCSELIKAPDIPKNVTLMTYTFYGCSKIIDPPNILGNTTSLFGAFYGCTKLKNPPNIPESTENMRYAFYNCFDLTNAPVIPNKAIDIYATFMNCKSLKGNIQINSNPNSYNYFLNGSAIDENHKILLKGNEINKQIRLKIKGENINIIVE